VPPTGCLRTHPWISNRTVSSDPASPLSPSQGPIGLIGLGLVGQTLAGHLLGAGWQVVGHDLRAEARDRLSGLGGHAAPDARSVCSSCRILLLSLPTDHIVAEVLQAGHPEPGSCVIDTSTGDPAAAVRQHAQLADRGVTYVDAPLSGSSQQLAARQAVFFLGTDSEHFAWLQPLFAALSPQVLHAGPPGSAARLKLVTNLVLGLNRAALAEGLHFAQALGLDPAQALHALQNSPAASRIMDGKGPKMLTRDYTPQARLSQHLKDVRLMLGAVAGTTDLPLTRRHAELLRLAETLGWGDHDNSALFEALPHWQPAASEGPDTSGERHAPQADRPPQSSA